jgi:hypothetical protein
METETIATMLIAVNAATEAFKRAISRFDKIDEYTKSALYFLFSLLAGIFVSFMTNAAPQFFERTLLANYPIAANILLGLALGYGSKATYFLMDLLANLREFAKLNAENPSVVVTPVSPAKPVG